MSVNEAVSSTKPCVSCGKNLPFKESPRCTECSSLQGEKCRYCRERLLPEALRCNNCGYFQKGWRNYFPTGPTALGFVTAIIAVISTGLIPVLSYVSKYHSDTYVTLIDADSDAIQLHLRNMGHKPSQLILCELEFGNLPYEDIELVPTDKTSAIVDPESFARVELKIPKDLTDKDASKSKATRSTLWVVIKESNNPKRTWPIPLPDSFQRDLLQTQGGS